MKISLADILEKWLADHESLKDHYHVYRINKWDSWAHGEWPYWLLDDARAFIGMTCDGINIGLAIMNDHVYYRNTKSGPKFKTMAADKDFFPKTERELIKFHKKTHKRKKCEIDADIDAAIR
jgi:hypothetical protein